MDQLVNYGIALEDEKNTRFGLSGEVARIIQKRSDFESEIPEEVKYRIRDLNSLIENKIIDQIDADPVVPERRHFASLFATETGSCVDMTPAATEAAIGRARGWLNQVAAGLKGAKGVTQRNGVAAWGVPLLEKCKKVLHDAKHVPNSNTNATASTNAVQLPEDVELMVLEVEHLIQSMIGATLDDFSFESSFETATRSLYHQVGAKAPVFIQQHQ